MTPEEFNAKWPEWCLGDGFPGATVRASGETQEQALDRLSAEIEERETVARHREIGELVERNCGGTLDGPLKIFPGFTKDDHWTVSLQSYSLGVVSVRGDTLLAALENLAKAIGGDDGKS